ncbi:Peptidyl-prolyl cis-trans isomerase CYP18-1 [Wickerhamiella sorbophila]|uniref:Peptidyl-prolyl cis-trans isomerase n=1 Tax=Wickerhamiella sorbophila TaxID=45607 RepID=A0A2T0FIY1_9ASCO|nr:Peptidyl-prolyl cis-trans isomerase CYP18-1 [Wickerhamiella sorbophila]PRT54948.1 Peptidyl-prolyl cis-trans isomerase CYP18-1 [Wickerhamiella sorbophila]
MSVSLDTSLGRLKIQLFYDECPHGCENFLAQCAQDNYDGIKAKRSEKGFIIQFPSKAPSIHPESGVETRPTIKHQRGTISLTKPGGSGFYFAYARQPDLDGNKTVFGRIIEGLDVLDKMEEAQTENNKPVTDITIDDTEIHFNPFALRSVGQLK